MLSHDEESKKVAEFYAKLQELVNANPSLRPDSPEIIALIDEWNKKYGIKIRLVDPRASRSDEAEVMSALLGLSELLKGARNDEEAEASAMGIVPPEEGVCKYHDTKLDSAKVELTRENLNNLTIDLHEKSDEEIWKMFE